MYMIDSTGEVIVYSWKLIDNKWKLISIKSGLYVNEEDFRSEPELDEYINKSLDALGF